MEYEVTYRLEIEGSIKVEADDPDEAEDKVRLWTDTDTLMGGLHLEDVQVENVEAQV